MLRAAPARAPRPRVYVPATVDRDVARSLRGQGFATIAGLDGAGDAAAEARRLGCSHLLADGAAMPLAQD